MTAKRVAKDALLGLAGVAGLACILWLLASTLLGASFVVFRTGSMAPTMPTGTAAIALPVAGEDITVGDVVMVERDGVLPVTHRVVSVEPDLETDGGVLLELRGDANETSDQERYAVTEARRIIFPVPGLGTAIELSRTPLFIGTATLLVATLVVWAFWPRRPDDEAADDAASTTDRAVTGPPRHAALTAKHYDDTTMSDRYSEVNQ